MNVPEKIYIHPDIGDREFLFYWHRADNEYLFKALGNKLYNK